MSDPSSVPAFRLTPALRADLRAGRCVALAEPDGSGGVIGYVFPPALAAELAGQAAEIDRLRAERDRERARAERAEQDIERIINALIWQDCGEQRHWWSNYTGFTSYSTREELIVVLRERLGLASSFPSAPASEPTAGPGEGGPR